MKKITKKLSTKYVKLHKCRNRQDGSMKSEEDGGEISRETHYSPENEERYETKETPKVAKIMESMHRKLMLIEKANKKNIHVDGNDQSQKFERSVSNGRDLEDQLDGSVRKINQYDGMDQLVGSVRNGHMDRLEDLIRGCDLTKGLARDRVDQLEGTSKNNQKHEREDNITKSNDQVDQSEGSNKNPSDFASKKDYIDWVEHVEGSSHHCFDIYEISENLYRKEDIDHDLINVGVSEGSVDGSNDEIILLKNSKCKKNEKFEDSKSYKKCKGKKVKDSLQSQMVD
ncbi:unnamed protein product [Cochlearia groenlandica]